MREAHVMLLRPVRIGLLLALVLGAAAVLGACAEAASGTSADAPPNVLIIVMDTTRADHCSVHGYPKPTTPNLERLADDGVRFQDAWAPAGWTAPSHASLFTGLRPMQHGLLDAKSLFLGTRFPTLAEHLRDAGWATGCFSNNDVVSEEFGLTRGFETIVPFFLLQDIPHPWAAGTHDRVLEFAKEASDNGRPFFAFINDFEPHLPYQPPAGLLAPFRSGVASPETEVKAREFCNPLTLRCSIGDATVPPDVAAVLPDLYDAEIAHLDREIGRLLDGLAEQGVLDRTLVVVTSDHGENLGDHGLWGHRFSLYRSVCHVPLVVRLPRLFDGGREVRDPVRLEDLMPTVLEACGLDVPDGLDGQSLLSDLPGRLSRATWSPQRWPREGLEEWYPSAADSPLFDRAVSAVYDGRYHLIEIDDEQIELYDVQEDPGETTNLASSLPEVVTRLRAELDK